MRMEVGRNNRQLPAPPPVLLSRYEIPDDFGNYYDAEELFKPNEVVDKVWDDPNFEDDQWADKPPKFKKGFNSESIF